MRLDQLEYILAIEESKSINKAAKKLFISPQTLCAALNSLEEELGFTIFVRNSKGVTLTYRGKKIISDIKDIIGTIDEWHMMTRGENEFSGEIKIAVATVCAPVLTSLIAEMKQLYPYSTIYMNSVNPNTMYSENMGTIEDDLLITAVPDEQYKRLYESIVSKGCSFEEIGYDYAQLVVSSKNNLAKKAKVAFEGLYEQEFATYRFFANDSFIGQDLSKYFKNGVSYIFNDKEQMQRMTVENKAVTMGLSLDKYENFHFKSGCLKMLPIENYDRRVTYVLSHPNKKKRSPLEDFMIEKIRSKFLQLQKEKVIF